MLGLWLRDIIIPSREERPSASEWKAHLPPDRDFFLVGRLHICTTAAV
jgi:hypothetical protein